MEESPLHTYILTSKTGLFVHDILHYNGAGLEVSINSRPDRTGLFQSRLLIYLACLLSAPAHIRKALTGRINTCLMNLTYVAQLTGINGACFNGLTGVVSEPHDKQNEQTS